MTARSTFELTIKGEDPPPESNTYLERIRTSTVVRKIVLQGSADDEMTVLFKEDTADFGTLATSATRSIDLQTALDVFGEALALTDVAMLYIKHKDASLASAISIQANASDGLTNLLSTTANLTLRPGDFIVLGAFTADNLVVAANNKVLDIINDDGSNVADYVVEVWGRI